MNHNRIERHVVAKGNLAMAARGQNLFSCPSGNAKPGEKLFYDAVAPGQLVAYVQDPDVGAIPQTIDNTDIATTRRPIFIGIGWDGDNDGVSDDIRLIAGEGIDKCEITEAEIGRPECGNPHFSAATIDCVECGTTYTARVTIDDNRSRSWGPIFKTGLEFIATYIHDCATCDDCPTDPTCDQIACGIVDSLNGELDLMLDGINYPDWKNPNLPRPYKAVVGHENWYSYCLTPDAAACECETCIQVTGIKAAVIDGVTVTFTGNLSPTAATKTLLPQLQNIAFQIERGFDDNIGKNSGFAFVAQGVTPCCAAQLHVITCDDQFELLDTSDAVIATCANGLTIPPEFTIVPTCVTCGDYAQGTLTFTGLPLDTETVVVDGITYTFLDTFVDADYNVHIGGTVQASIDNLVSAVTGVATGAAVEGTDFPTGGLLLKDTSTVGSEFESATATTVVFRASASGVAGNAIPTTETLTNGSFGAATMAGGTDESGDTTVIPPCWIGLLVDPAKPDCDCYLEKTWNWYGVNAELTFIKDPNDPKPSVRTQVLQEATTPRNFGGQIQWLEYKYGFAPAGRGRRHRASNYRRGYLNKWDDTSRIKNAVTADCDALYCSYFLDVVQDNRSSLGPGSYKTDLRSGIHIALDDTTTITSWETFFNALTSDNDNNCKVIGAVACIQG